MVGGAGLIEIWTNRPLPFIDYSWTTRSRTRRKYGRSREAATK